MYKKLILLSLVSLIVLLNLSFGKKKTKKDKLTDIAKEYSTYTKHFAITFKIKPDSPSYSLVPFVKVDSLGYIYENDTVSYKWSVPFCIAPEKIYRYHKMKTKPVQLDKAESMLISQADLTRSPHGNKLYQLFIKNNDAYTNAKMDTQPVGQVIVKEVWNAQAIQHDSKRSSFTQIQSRNDGKWYTPTTVSQLFIMYKEKQDSTNDKGWVYGIVDIEDNKPKPVVLFEGKISTCMSCHANTKYDRMFGLK
jgi:Cytochrome P460